MTKICYADGMSSYLYRNGVRVFDYANFAEPYRNLLRANAKKLAEENGIKIDHINKPDIRKEDVVQAALEKLQKGEGGGEGEASKVEGLFYIISAMERCPTYTPYFDKKKNWAYLKSDWSQCLHYYFYFIDKYLGLCYVRVPTWLPCRLQIYFNGHNWLANMLSNEGIEYQMGDNAFLSLGDCEKAQEISNSFSIKVLHRLLDKFAETYCPIFKLFGSTYHWSVMQVEYSTDIIFRYQRDLQAIYENLVRTAIHTVKPDHIASFLGRKLAGHYKGEVGNNYKVRIEGNALKHRMGKVLIKMYDKFQKVLRIETASTDISHFNHYRQVEHKDGTTSKKFTYMKKYIYSLGPLINIMTASNRRYLEFISAIEDKRAGTKRLRKVTQRIEENNRGYKGFNFFDDNDMQVVQIIIRGEFNISGFRNKDIRNYLSDKSTGQISRILKRLKIHGLIKKARNSYKYYLTKLGKQVALLALKLKELVIIPALNY
jgi:hypothetical protein